MRICTHKIPGLPIFLFFKPVNDREKFSVKEQTLFWSRIGLLPFLVKQLRSNIANATWELPKVMDGVNKAAFLEMHWIVNYVLDINVFDLKRKLIKMGDHLFHQ